MSVHDTDVLIVGSGFGAAAPALRLAEAGFRVTVVEKGRRLDPLRDFRQSQDPKYLLRYLKGVSGDHLGLTYAEALGGGSGFYEMVSLRAPTKAFEQRDTAGRRLWPTGIDRRALDPYFDRAEKMLRVEQIAPEDVPKTGQVFSLMMQRLGYSADRARYAVRGCVGSGFCVSGCIYGAKQSLLLNYLPQAVSAGALVETDLDAEFIVQLGGDARAPIEGSVADLPYRYGVACRATDGSGERRSYRAKILVLAGGTVGTAKLLLRSARQLPHLSRAVGRHIAFNGSVKAAGLLPEWCPDGDMFTGRSHPGMVSYQFLESHGLMLTTGKPLPLQVVASARLRLDGDARHPHYWGEANVELMQRYRRRMMVLIAFGMTPPLGRMEQTGDGFDVRLDVTGALRDYYRETKALLHSLITRTGGRVIHADFVDGEGRPRRDLFFSTAHQVGSCRMADRKADGVVNAAGEVFDYPGLYVSDGAAVPSSLAVNTSLTILANAERIADGIVLRHGARPAIAAAS